MSEVVKVEDSNVAKPPIYRPVWKDQLGNRLVIPVEGIGSTNEAEAIAQQKAIAPMVAGWGFTPDGLYLAVEGVKVRSVSVNAIIIGTFFAIEGPALEQAIDEPIPQLDGPVPTLH
jgi:hypothetical protein